MSMDMEGTGAIVDTAAMAAAGVPAAAADVNGRRPSVGMRNPKEGLNIQRGVSLKFRT